MFWACFSYDKKGPCHCWKVETAAERKAAQAELAAISKAKEAEDRLVWESSTGIRRINLDRNPGGKKPVWRHAKENGAVTRGKGNGIDWWRYQKTILIPKLIPFAKKCMESRPDTLVQEDRALAHASKYQDQVFIDAGVARLEWPGNSPDINSIEPCWRYMKKVTTRKVLQRTERRRNGGGRRPGKSSIRN